MRGAEREAYDREQAVLTRLKDALENEQPLREVIPSLIRTTQGCSAALDS